MSASPEDRPAPDVDAAAQAAAEASDLPQGDGATQAGAGDQPAPAGDAAAAGDTTGDASGDQAGDQPGEQAEPASDAVLAAERLVDLQRLQAEYVNYRRRVERDRDVARDSAVASVLEALLPVCDDIHLAREHGDLEGGPFASIADKLESTLRRFGFERYGAAGESFDPAVHEALMHVPQEQAAQMLPDLGEVDAATVVQVLQPGYKAGERVLRPARVSVVDPH